MGRRGGRAWYTKRSDGLPVNPDQEELGFGMGELGSEEALVSVVALGSELSSVFPRLLLLSVLPVSSIPLSSRYDLEPLPGE